MQFAVQQLTMEKVNYSIRLSQDQKEAWNNYAEKHFGGKIATMLHAAFEVLRREIDNSLDQMDKMIELQNQILDKLIDHEESTGIEPPTFPTDTPIAKGSDTNFDEQIDTGTDDLNNFMDQEDLESEEF